MRVLVERTASQLVEALEEAGAIPVLGELTPEGFDADVALVDVEADGGNEVVRRFVDALPTCRLIVVTTRRREDLAVPALLQGARDFVTRPLDLVPQLRRALARLEGDNASPAAFMERLVAYHELGEMLLRSNLVAPERLAAARAQVVDGASPNLFEALRASGYVADEDLRETLDWGHTRVSMALLLMKTRVVTMQQLRTAFVMARNRHRGLEVTLQELQFATPEQIAEAMKRRGPDDDPPPASMALRRPR